MALAYDLPVLSSSEVKDLALVKACKLVEFMISDKADLRRKLLNKKKKFAVLGEFEVIKDIPEYADLPLWYNKRARGLGGTEWKRLTVSAEENLRCLASDRYSEDIYIHEVSSKGIRLGPRKAGIFDRLLGFGSNHSIVIRGSVSLFRTEWLTSSWLIFFAV